MKKTLCDKCHNEISNNNISKHRESCDGKYISPLNVTNIRTCIHCNIKFDVSSNKNFMSNHTRWCKENPNRIQRKVKTKKEKFNHTEETKKLISEKRKLWLKENPDKHPWKRKSKFDSKPCIHLKDYLRSKGVSFVEEFQPIEDRFYSIDIAFPDIKVGIEVNGNQHYNSDGTLTTYYQTRHDNISNAGWTLLEIHYTMVYNHDKIDEILIEREQPDYSEYFDKREKKKKEIKLNIKLNKNETIISEKVHQILHSEINFNKFGWVGKVAVILNIPPQKVGYWMKRNMPELYQNCFKRSSR